MAWIDTITELDAKGELKRLYKKVTEPWGGVDNIMKIHSINPASLEAHLTLYKTVMFGKSPIPLVEREMIAVVVSALNNCHY